MLPPVILQFFQVLTLLVFAPMVTGVISRVEALLQARKGPSVLQPYYDIFKLLRKGRSVPEDASWVYFLAPYVAFAAYVTIAMLIPVLTNFPLPLGYMGDILGGAFLFALAGFFVALAGLDSGSPYSGLGASRTMMVTVLVEPTLIFVFFVVALISSTDLPYSVEIPLTVNVGSSLIAALALTGVSYAAALKLPLRGVLLPQSAFSIGLAVVLIGFFFMITRPNTISQVIGFLTVENGIFLATVAVAPGLPLLVGILILFDVLVGVLVFGVLVRLLAVRGSTITTTNLRRLRG